MSERKNIDDFFQERLEHFEVTPPELVWENIEAKLKEKKKRRVIPFWWKFSGVAALLVIGFMVFAPYFHGNVRPVNPVVDQQNKAIPSSGENAVGTEKGKASLNEEAVVSNEKNIPANTKEENQTNTTAPTSKNTNAVAGKESLKEKSTVVSVSNTKKNVNTFGKKAVNSTALASNTSENRKGQKTGNTSKGQSIAVKTTSETSIATTVGEKKATPSDQPLDLTNQPGKSTIANIDRTTELSIGNNLNGKKEEIKNLDSTKLAVVEPNALEELLNEKEKKIAKGRKENRWQVTPNIAPIYFSSMSNGSPLDEKLAANEKMYGTNYSYGLGVNYAVNKKLRLRSGLHTFSADYDTKGIVFYQNTNASKMQNVTPNIQGSIIQIDPLNNVNTSFGKIIEDKFEGTLNQRMAYVEMPLEVSYSLLANKFGIDLIGGVSTLFLSQNDVYLKSTGFTMKIGEANNLNNIHFSTNIGLGLKYAFFKRFDARVEPLFKYQLNTYSSGAGNFKPYVFGVYSGITYHF